MWPIAIASLLFASDPSVAVDLSLSFVERLEREGLLEEGFVGPPTVQTDVPTSDSVVVRIHGRYSVTVFLPLRQITGFEDSVEVTGEPDLHLYDGRRFNLLRRMGIVYGATNAPGVVEREEEVSGIMVYVLSDVAGYARIRYGSYPIAERPYFRFRQLSGRLAEYRTEPIPVPHVADRFRPLDEVLYHAAVAAFRLRDRLGPTAPWDALGLCNGPYNWVPVYWRPVRLTGGEPLAEPYASQSRRHTAIPVWWVRFAASDLESETGSYVPVCEAILDATTGEAISAGIVWATDEGFGTFAARWTTWRFQAAVVGGERHPIRGPTLGAEASESVAGREVEILLELHRSYLRAFYRPNSRTVRIGSRVFHAGLGLSRAMEEATHGAP